MDLKRATQVKIENIEMLIVLELTDMPPYVLRWHKRIRTIQLLPEDSSLKDIAAFNYPEHEHLDTVQVLRKQLDIVCREFELLN